jgi:hypothetical protein
MHKEVGHAGDVKGIVPAVRKVGAHLRVPAGSGAAGAGAEERLSWAAQHWLCSSQVETWDHCTRSTLQLIRPACIRQRGQRCGSNSCRCSHKANSQVFHSGLLNAGVLSMHNAIPRACNCKAGAKAGEAAGVG